MRGRRLRLSHLRLLSACSCLGGRAVSRSPRVSSHRRGAFPSTSQRTTWMFPALAQRCRRNRQLLLQCEGGLRQRFGRAAGRSDVPRAGDGTSAADALGEICDI